MKRFVHQKKKKKKKRLLERVKDQFYTHINDIKFRMLLRFGNIPGQLIL